MSADGSPQDPVKAGKTYYLPKGLHARLKAAWWATQEHPTLSALVASVFTAESERRELAFNDGLPFPTATAALGPRARSVDGESHTYYLPVSVHERLVSAWAGTRSHPAAAASVSALASEVLEAEADRLERRFNNGEPFAPAPIRARGVDPQAARRQGEKMAELWQKRRSEKK
jgi:hypothetical protein